MDELAPAKINLALHILGRRPDGYHDLDSIVAFADVADRLSLEPADGTSLDIIGPFSAGLDAGEGNLVLQAHRLLAEHAKLRGAALPEFRFRLEKNLPVAAGIGGGSADAAAALRLMMRFSGITAEANELNALALKLGADVPVCLSGKSCRMRGLGEQLETIALPDWKALVLVNPRIASSTVGVFGKLGLLAGQTHGSPLEPKSPGTWRNDLQAPAQALVPEIAAVLAALAEEPAIRAARMSGSGATCFGATDSFAEAQAIAAVIARRYPHWWVKAAAILD
jgi:4-diphosphocytidyl-2-C-methyl-D-erythritol kinase